MVASSTKKVKTPTSVREMVKSTSAVTTALVARRAATGAPLAVVFAKARGKRPSCAIALGSSPCSSVQPFRAPRALIAANNDTARAAPLPQTKVARSANGALDAATRAAGRSSRTAAHAVALKMTVSTVPHIVAR